jgi:hypothetical protein
LKLTSGRWKHPQFLLILLSPMIAELFSGSTPFAVFFSPFVFLVYLGFYGLGALIIREIVVRRRLNFSSVLLLGAAYGILEEGIVIKSWFDPNWMGAAVVSHVLRVYGISVLQPLSNVVFHAVISIGASILIVQSVTQSGVPWLSKRWTLFASGLFVISAIAIALTFNYNYKIAGWQYLLCFVLLAIFAVLGWKGLKIPSGTKMYPPLGIWILNILFIILLFTIFYTLSYAGANWFVIIPLALVLYVGYAIIFALIDWGRATRKHYFAAAAGIVTGLLPLSLSLARSQHGRYLNVLAEVTFIIILIIVYSKLD